jgi:hypothetical protein
LASSLLLFYSDLFELGYEAVGEVDARLETVADWREPSSLFRRTMKRAPKRRYAMPQPSPDCIR